MWVHVSKREADSQRGWHGIGRHAALPCACQLPHSSLHVATDPQPDKPSHYRNGLNAHVSADAHHHHQPSARPSISSCSRSATFSPPSTPPSRGVSNPFSIQARERAVPLQRNASSPPRPAPHEPKPHTHAHTSLHVIPFPFWPMLSMRVRSTFTRRSEARSVRESGSHGKGLGGGGIGRLATGPVGPRWQGPSAAPAKR